MDCLPEIPNIQTVGPTLKNLDLPKNVLVTGGSGFVGKWIVAMLVHAGCNVSIFDLRCGLSDDRVTFIQGDLTKMDDCSRAVIGKDAVIHVASPHASCQNRKILDNVNVLGTQNILNASANAGIKKFVYTSSASVVFDGSDQKGVDEDFQYPATFRDYYCETKAKAEKIVRDFDGTNGLRTCSIRPHGIFGPGDVQFFPTLIDNARRGKTKYIIGNGKNVVDFTFVGNVAFSHILGLHQLSVAPEKVGGKVYFITNSEPIPFWDFIGDILEAFGWERPRINLPYGLIFFISLCISFIAILLSPVVKIQPTFTPSTVQLAAKYHYYSSEKATKELGYKPLWNLKDALNVSVSSFPNLFNPQSKKKIKSSPSTSSLFYNGGNRKT